MKQSSSQRTPAPTYLLSVLFFSLAFFTSSLEAFTNPALPKTIVSAKQQTTSTSYARKKYSPLYLSTPSPSSAGSSSSSSSIPVPPPDDVQFERFDGVTPSDEWELDCYSRPVVVNGKKLWEVLLTDSTGSFRFIKTLPSNQVNSKNVRATVESMMEEYVDKYGLETPGVIRFFRGAMFNMINIALMDLEVVAKPSRCTFALAQWLEERNRDVYPKMER